MCTDIQKKITVLDTVDDMHTGPIFLYDGNNNIKVI
jgi:hypothetical protein